MSFWSDMKSAIIWEMDQLRTPVFPIWGKISKTPVPFQRHILDDGAVIWPVATDPKLPHYDHIEMTGFKAAMIISYGARKNEVMRISRHITFPSLRKIPNDTGGSFAYNFPNRVGLKILVDQKRVRKEYCETIRIDGHLEFINRTTMGITIKHTLFPAVHEPAGIEKVTVKNTGKKSCSLSIASPDFHYTTPARRGVYGAYEVVARLAGPDGVFRFDESPVHTLTLSPQDTYTVYLVFSARKQGETIEFNVLKEETARQAYLDQVSQALVLETPEKTLDTMFRLTKVRAAESIIQTKGGLMHAPGGGGYYAALWTNDQCEYANPLFPFIGYMEGNASAINSYKQFMRFMDPGYEKPLVSSIIAEGDDYWNGAGDRGDAAMFAYGASRFALAYGDLEVAKTLWPGIEWSLNYSLKKKNDQGVIESDSDELENRFESGHANLFTSSLVYDALQSAILLGKELDLPKTLLKSYASEREQLHEAIENYFGAEVEGYKTYRYYDGNTVLRSWICIPLVMGIEDRAKETIKALVSDRLWTPDGLRTQAGKKTFWDRSTLYGLRGIFIAGHADLGLEYLKDYTTKRILKEHVPYPVEAYPEGNQKHLAGESALYARIFTEGLFGIRPTGFKSFEMNVQMPSAWDHMALRHIQAFKETFDLEVMRKDSLYHLAVKRQGKTIYEATSKKTFMINFRSL